MSEEAPNELEQLKKERDEYLNGWKRAKADLINYQKEEIQRLDEMAKYAKGSLVKDLIAVLDSFDLALAVLEKDGKAEKGFYMIKGHRFRRRHFAFIDHHPNISRAANDSQVSIGAFSFQCFIDSDR